MTMKLLLSRRGRPTKYTKETSRRVMHYTKTCSEKGDFPTIEHLASYLGVSTRSLYDWEKEHSEFMQTMDSLRDAQRHLLMQGGLTNKYNAKFASFLLKANHGMSDTKSLFHATQNNTLNVSPEIMTDALALMKENEEKRSIIKKNE